jgi:thiamine-phosphate pyrophosphorylase
MTKVPEMPPVQLYLVTPPVSDAAAFLPTLKALLDAAPLASVLLRLHVGDDTAAKAVVRAIAPVVQARNAALLVEGWPSIVARAGADGIHCLDQRQGLREAVESFKPERIVGVGGVRSKHDAMTLAESGADYVMLGEPGKDNRPPPLDSVIERTEWWAELFQVPCVAYAPDLSAVPLLADAGADFVALGDAVFEHENGPTAALQLAQRLLAQREP